MALHHCERRPPSRGSALPGVRRLVAGIDRGSMGTIEVGELLYEYTVKLTGMTEYGVSFASVMAGTTAPPPEGARFDVPFEGEDLAPRRWCRSPPTRKHNRRSARERDPLHLCEALLMGQRPSSVGHRHRRPGGAGRSHQGLFGLACSVSEDDA